MTAWKAKQPGGGPRALESLRSRGFCPKTEGQRPGGRGRWERAKATSLQGRWKGTLPDWSVLVPGAALPEWWERLVDPEDSVESISGAF